MKFPTRHAARCVAGKADQHHPATVSRHPCVPAWLAWAVVMTLLCLVPRPAEAQTGAQTPATVVAWGNNDYGQRTVPAELSDVVALAADGLHSLALKGDGTVVA